jgi:hypothetical protein
MLVLGRHETLAAVEGLFPELYVFRFHAPACGWLGILKLLMGRT